MSGNDVSGVLAGRVGRFREWTGAGIDETRPPTTGYLRQNGSQIEVVVAAEDALNELSIGLTTGARHGPDALLGVLERETVLLTGLRPVGTSFRSGQQPMLQTTTYRADNMVVGIYDVAGLKGVQLKKASVVFTGMLRWAGFSSLRVESEEGNDGLIRRGRIDLLPLPSQARGRIRNGQYVGVDLHWTTQQD